MVYSHTKNPNSGIFEVLGMENATIFYDHLEYFAVIWYILWEFGMVCGHLVYFLPFWYFWTKKNLAALVNTTVQSFRKYLVFLPMKSFPTNSYEEYFFSNNFRDRFV
jgi:hypothetical protein